MFSTGHAFRALGVALVLGCLTTGCVWSEAGHDAGRGGWNDLENQVTAANVHGLHQVWSKPIGQSPNEAIINSGRVFVRSNGALDAYALADGSKPWPSVALPGDAVPGFGNGVLYVPTDGTSTTACQLVTVDPATGAVTGHTDTGPPVASFLTTAVCVTDSALLAGTKVIVPTFVLQATIAPHCGNTYKVGDGIAAIDESNSNASWFFDGTAVSCGTPPPIPPRIGPFTRAGALAIATEGSTVFGYSLTDCGNVGSGCRATWSRDIGSDIVGPAVVLPGNTIAVATTSGNVLVLDATTGTTKFTDAVGAVLAEPVAATSSTLFAAATDGTLAAFPAGGCGAATCNASWTATTPQASTRPSIGGDVVYVGSSDGTVTAFNANGCGAATCASLWSANTGSEVTGAPAIASGHVVVGSGTTVTAYALGS